MAGIKVFVKESHCDEREFLTFDDYGNIEAGEYYKSKEIDRGVLWGLINQLADTGLKFNNRQLKRIAFHRVHAEGDLEVWLHF